MSLPFALPQEGHDEKVAAAPSSPSSAGAMGGEAAGDDDPSPEYKAVALRSLKEEIALLPHDRKSSLVHAQRIDPDLVDDEHLMSFLEAEDFDVDLALKRLLRYWENRYKVFGPDKFALPMTLKGAMRDNIEDLKQGYLILLPVPDEAGRAIIFSNTSLYKDFPRDPKIHVWWYLIHTAMSDPSMRKNGFVVLANSAYAGLNNFDPKYTLATCSSGDRYFPIRWKMTHVLHANAVFPYVASAVKAVLSPDQRKSFFLHNGSDEAVLESLSSYFLPKHCLPSSIGGSLHVSAEEFVRERLIIEGDAENTEEESSSRDFNEECNDSVEHPVRNEPTLLHNQKDERAVKSISRPGKDMPKSLEAGMSSTHQHGTTTEGTAHDANISNSSGKTCDNVDVDQNDMSSKHRPAKSITPEASTPHLEGSAAQKIQAKRTPPSATLPTGAGSTASQCTAMKRPGPKVEATGPKKKRGRGRASDPRMALAVQAALDNPQMTMIAALTAGGFVFPDMDKPGVKKSDLKDTDGITLYQRRNQLMRRLRLAKEKASK